jgi:hypothetical protein
LKYEEQQPHSKIDLWNCLSDEIGKGNREPLRDFDLKNIGGMEMDRYENTIAQNEVMCSKWSGE